MSNLGLIKRRECLLPTLVGWAILLLLVMAVLVIAILAIHPFLAVNHPVDSGVLVVEGWLPDYALENAIREFQEHDYKLLITTGGPLELGSHLSEYRTYAELSASTLRHLGLDEEAIMAVPAPAVTTDRTYASAVALRNRLSTSGSAVKSVNIYSLGPHARRTRLLFEKALGENIEVGVFAATDINYDPQKWWTSSRGVRALFGELIAYVYARFFFSSERLSLIGR